MRSRELVHLVRSGFVDLIHYGSLVVTDIDGEIIYSVGDPERCAFFRSSSKPLQVIPAVESGALEKFNISDTELAIMCGSHAGQDIHAQTVRSILSKISLSEYALRCSKENAIRDNCSGKHAGMLTLCRFYDFPIDTYLEPEHPAQLMIRKVIGEICDIEDVRYGVDGCGVPTFYIPLSKMAVGFARLANPDNLSSDRKKAVMRITKAMQAHPVMTGEVRNSKTWPKKIVAKAGALGVYCGGILNQNRGIAVKIDDGSYAPCALVFTEIIRRLNLVDRSELDSYQELYPPIERNRRGDIVARMEIAF